MTFLVFHPGSHSDIRTGKGFAVTDVRFGIRNVRPDGAEIRMVFDSGDRSVQIDLPIDATSSVRSS